MRSFPTPSRMSLLAAVVPVLAGLRAACASSVTHLNVFSSVQSVSSDEETDGDGYWSEDAYCVSLFDPNFGTLTQATRDIVVDMTAVYDLSWHDNSPNPAQISLMGYIGHNAIEVAAVSEVHTYDLPITSASGSLHILPSMLHYTLVDNDPYIWNGTAGNPETRPGYVGFGFGYGARDRIVYNGNMTGTYTGTYSMSYTFTPASTVGSGSFGTGVGSSDTITNDCDPVHYTGDLVVGDYGSAVYNQSCGTVTVDGTLYTARHTGSSGTYNLSGGILNAPNVVNNGAFNFTGGSANLSTLTGTGATTVASGRSLSLNQLRQGTLDANGTVTIAQNGGNSGVVRLNSLTIGSNGKLDLNDNDLVVDYTGASPFTTLNQYVSDGFGGSHGITSSTATGSQLLVLVDNNDSNVNGSYTQWPPGSGQTIDATTIFGKYTYLGDVDLDGQVGSSDYLAMWSYFGQTGLNLAGSWILGDVDRDGAVGSSDLMIVDTYRGSGSGNPLAPSVQAVPEPSSLLAVLASLPFFRRRSRRRRRESVPPSRSG